MIGDILGSEFFLNGAVKPILLFGVLLFAALIAGTISSSTTNWDDDFDVE